jgi:lysophospholipase L1-like esterase
MHLRVLGLLVCSLAGFGLAADPSSQPSPALLPTLWIIGDSTVSNPQDGMAGWGKPIAQLFDSSKIRVQNRARGGRSSRTYAAEGLWDQVVAQIRPGDIVIVQFGHNDGGPLVGERARGALKGNGDETETVTRTDGATEVVHTFGWYMRKYVSDAKSKGAMEVILCSHIPRRQWDDSGKVIRNKESFGKWTKEAAEQSGALFLDLNEIIAQQYEQIGRDRVTAEFFKSDHTHTTVAGAELNARCVVEGIRALPGCQLKAFLAAP